MVSREQVRRIAEGSARKIATRIRGTVRRGILRSLGDEDTRLAQFGLLAGDTADGVEVFEPYGFTSAPVGGAEAVVVSVGGDPAHLIAVVVGDRRYRVKGLADGEVAIGTDSGAQVVLREDGSIEVTPSGLGKVHIGGPTATDTLALHDELKDILGDIHSILGTLLTFWQGLVPAAWAADSLLVKAAWAGVATPLGVVLAKIAAAQGSPKGLG